MPHIVDQHGRPLTSALATRMRQQRQIRTDRAIPARYRLPSDGFFSSDLYRNSTRNDQHWQHANYMSADADGSYEIRRVERARARLEYQNNSYCHGLVLTKSNDTIGAKGPQLQILSDEAKEAARSVEAAFRDWADEIQLARKLTTMRQAWLVDGESFAMFVNNDALEGDVKLDLRLIEADQVTSLGAESFNRNELDGITVNDVGTPISYRILPNHPGGTEGVVTDFFQDPESIDAKDVIHLFRPLRPGQHRGRTELLPALPLFAVLRRYTMAVLGAAETAADIAGILHTNGSPGETIDELEEGEMLPIAERMLMTAPYGYQVTQLKAEQPTTQYGEFKREILNEAARCILMPFNVAASNSSQYNFASGRLDNQGYFKAIDVDRQQIELTALRRILRKWFDEAVLVGLISSGLGPLVEWSLRWFWEPREPIDPLKHAQAIIALHDKKLKTDDDVFFDEGKDPDQHYQSLKRQVESRKEAGAEEMSEQPAMQPAGPPEDGENEDDDER